MIALGEKVQLSIMPCNVARDATHVASKFLSHTGEVPRLCGPCTVDPQVGPEGGGGRPPGMPWAWALDRRVVARQGAAGMDCRWSRIVRLKFIFKISVAHEMHSRRGRKQSSADVRLHSTSSGLSKLIWNTTG